MRRSDHLGVLAIQSGSRPGAYLDEDVYEHRFYFEKLTSDPGFRERILTQVAAEATGFRSRAKLKLRSVVRKRLIDRLGYALGLNPRELDGFFRYGRRGRMIPELRARRGLDPRV